jgi:site-specific DNA-methyltransferase (adenine-specific)
MRSNGGNYAKYLRTRFVRFLVSLRKSTQHATRDVYAFIPDLPLDQENGPTPKLYKRYGLTKDEIAFIESQVAEHDEQPLAAITGRRR